MFVARSQSVTSTGGLIRRSRFFVMTALTFLASSSWLPKNWTFWWMSKWIFVGSPGRRTLSELATNITTTADIYTDWDIDQLAETLGQVLLEDDG